VKEANKVGRLESDQPVLTVCIITYNHEKYIEKCLLSVINQNIDCPWEIVIGDDCSTDSTPKIIQSFAKKYAPRIKVITQTKNTGGTRNYLDVHAAARGKYVAHLDGDDYILQGKLEKQIKFLEENLLCSFVCHKVKVVNEDETRVLRVNPQSKKPKYSDLKYLVENYIFFDHSSKMYRRSVNNFKHDPKDAIIDFYFHVEHASAGLVGYIDEILGVHRITGKGISSRQLNELYLLFEATIAAYDRARELGVDSRTVKRGKAKYLIGAAALCLARSDKSGFTKYIERSRVDGEFLSASHSAVYNMRSFTTLVRLMFVLRDFTVRVLRSTR
jgi:glycosyltransferase involved in cell wall biosynthesis